MKVGESQLIFREDSGQENREERKEDEVEVKIEELVEPAPKMTEGSPSTVIPYVSSTFGEMPLSFNFLFYGNYYQ